METMNNFKNRCSLETGLSFEAIPRGVPEDLLGGQILCKRGSLYLVTSGYPVVTDGEEIYHNFLLVDMLLVVRRSRGGICPCGM